MKVALICVCCLLFFFPMAASDSIGKGDALPEGLSPLNQDGEPVQLDTYRGKWMILYFYPKDDTPGCRREAMTYSSLIDGFNDENAVVFGINTDSAESHRAFIDKYDLKIDLLVDDEEKLIKLFDVSTTFGFCSRDTVLIGPDGIVERVYRGVSPEGNPKEILEYLQQTSNGN